MDVNINGRVYTLNFGIEFLREIDKRYQIRMDESGVGVGFGMGLVLLLPQLNTGSPVAIYDVIMAGTATEKSKPSRVDVENYIFGDDVDLLELAESFTKEFDKSPKIRKTMETILKLNERVNEANRTQEAEEKPDLEVVEKKSRAK